MLEQQSAAEIGNYGFSHYSGRPITPGEHLLLLVPQSIADGWEGLCSCGEWRAFTTLYDYPTRDTLIAAIEQRHRGHVEAKSLKAPPAA